MAAGGWGKRLLRVLKLTLLCAVLLSVGSVLAMRWVNPLTSSFMVQDRVRALLSGDAGYRFAHRWVDWAHIAAPMKLAVIASEDQKFAEHDGFDLASMQKAWHANQRGRRIRGGSTISQQVAKNLYLWPGHSYVRKGIEAYFTVLIEAMWPKRRILEVYLNSAEFGPGVFGVEAASQRYFHKPAARLSRADAALLAAVLPAPKRFLVARPSRFTRTRQAWIIRQMDYVGGPALLAHLPE